MWKKTTSPSVSSKLWIVSRRLQRCPVNPGRMTQQQATSASGTPPPPKQPPVKPPPTEIPKAPPPPPKKGGVFGKLLAVTVLGGAGVVGYAWYDEKFRSTMADTVPYSRTALDAVFQYLPDSPTVPAILSRDQHHGGDSDPKVAPPLPLFFPPLPETPTAEQEPMVQEPPVPPPTPKEDMSQQMLSQVRRDEERREAEERRQREAKEVEERKNKEVYEARRRRQEREDGVAQENTDLETTLGSLVTDCERRVEDAISLMDDIVQTTKHHTSLLRTAMDDNDKILEKDDQWQSVSMAMDTRHEAVNAAEQAITDAKAELEKVRNAIDEGRANAATKKNKALTKTKEALNQLSSEFNKKSTEVAKVESEARVLLNCKGLIDAARTQFTKELESITPDVSIGAKRGAKMTEEDLNLLLAHAHRRVSQLQQQLAKHVAMEKLRLQDALSIQQGEDNQLTEQKLSQERDRLRDEFALQRQRLEAEIQVEFESQLRHQLALQAAAHSDHLQDVLRVREKEMDHAYEKRLLDRLVEERAKFSLEISGWVARLKGIESAVDARAEVEKMRLQEQQMWVACVALNNTINAGGQGRSWEDQLLPLVDKVTAVQDAAIRHPFVDVVVESIPHEALQRGVYTEQNLRERFLRVNKIARRVAWLDNNSGSLMQYLTSYIKSIVRFPLTYRLTRSADEELDIEADGSVSDNFELLVTARYWLDKGDMQQVVRLMNQLQGESQRVAADWVREARLHLAAQQAAHILLAFAAASGLGSIG